MDLSKLDLTDVTFKLSQLGLKALSGKPIETRDYQVKVAVPTDLADLLDKLAEQVGINKEDLYSSLASEGIRRTLEFSVQQTTQKKTAESSPIQGLEKFTEGLQKISSLAQTLQGMQGTLEQVANAANEIKKDNP